MTMKFSYDGFGINDKEDAYASRIATFSNAYKGRDDIGQLLAAAPELLEALKEATRCLAWHETKHGVAMDGVAVANARAAIAKATEQR